MGIKECSLFVEGLVLIRNGSLLKNHVAQPSDYVTMYLNSLILLENLSSDQFFVSTNPSVNSEQPLRICFVLYCNLLMFVWICFVPIGLIRS